MLLAPEGRLGPAGLARIEPDLNVLATLATPRAAQPAQEGRLGPAELVNPSRKPLPVCPNVSLFLLAFSSLTLI